MGFWTLFEVASMPIIQVLIISTLGAFMATNYLGNLLSSDARNSLNKIVFMVFTPSLMFASLSQTMTFGELIAWWFMPVNVGLTFLFGGILGWIAVKILKPKPHLEGLIIAMSSSGNLGNLLLIIIPAICSENGSPFGDRKVCRSVGLSYAAFSMALGGFFIWTYTYQLVRSSALRYKALEKADEIYKVPNENLEADVETRLLEEDTQEHVPLSGSSTRSIANDMEKQAIVLQRYSSESKKASVSFLDNVMEILHQILEELLAPPTLAAILGFIFGAIPWLKHLLVGDEAPLRVLQDSIKLLGDGTIPSITLILGGNLTQGLKEPKIRPITIVAVICVRYVFLPIIGIGVVKVANGLGLLPPDPLFQFVLLIQFALPPAMNIGTMTQLFDVAQEECSVLMMWTYLAACLSLTVWSTIYMSILS